METRLRIVIDADQVQGKSLQDIRQMLDQAEIVIAKRGEVTVPGTPIGELQQLVVVTVKDTEIW